MIGELVLLSFKRNVRELIPCDGREITIKEYPALFSLIGTTYGGNGQTTFRIPKIVDAPVPGAQWHIHSSDEYPELDQ